MYLSFTQVHLRVLVFYDYFCKYYYCCVSVAGWPHTSTDLLHVGACREAGCCYRTAIWASTSWMSCWTPCRQLRPHTRCSVSGSPLRSTTASPSVFYRSAHYSVSYTGPAAPVDHSLNCFNICALFLPLKVCAVLTHSSCSHNRMKTAVTMLCCRLQSNSPMNPHRASRQV